MRYINYSPPPTENDKKESLFHDYIFMSDEYMPAYYIKQILDNTNWYDIDYSSLIDDIFCKNGQIKSYWCIAITMMPKDALRLQKIANHLPKPWFGLLIDADDYY